MIVHPTALHGCGPRNSQQVIGSCTYIQLYRSLTCEALSLSGKKSRAYSESIVFFFLLFPTSLQLPGVTISLLVPGAGYRYSEPIRVAHT